ncbi:uncharacterized protein EV422DRAFT_548447, partial [Fimicolochytrium jonesii]|uniref:uncharacterized protein n=1 Tax=Fimicolochytrium jonesii TaxID=1396493 RepID=UPI0022FEFE8E
MLSLRSLPLLLVTATAVVAQLANYNCDATACKAPACRCASATPPVDDPPMFLTLTFDDSVQASVWKQAQALFANRKNPNGCPARATWYTQVDYSDPYMVTQWYAQGNEIADHTITHSFPTNAEIVGMAKWANELAGIPKSKIKGFRFPLLNYTAEAFGRLSSLGFEYESSLSATGPDNVWPYTLDYGTVNACLGAINICGQDLKAKGMWEIPMYSAMDPYNLPILTAPTAPAQVTANYKTDFDNHYKTGRVPYGVYLHPTWLTANTPGQPDGTAKLAAVNAFLDYAMAQPNTWMVTGSQLIEYMKNPVPAAQLASQPYMNCQPNPAPPTTICNGLAGDAATGNAAPETCNFATGAFRTCYGCPSAVPSLADASPASTSTRARVPATCDPLWWDPIAAKCLCTVAACAPGVDPTGAPGNTTVGTNSTASANGTTPSNGSSGSSGNSTTNAKNSASSVMSGLGTAAAVVLGSALAL